MFKNIKAFILGVREFRLTYTTGFNEGSLSNAYDWGREWMHRLTLRHFEPF